MSQSLSSMVDFSWIEITATKFKNAKVLWTDRDEELKHDSESLEKYHEALIDESAYGICGTPCFSNIEFDGNDKKSLLVERYGGAGVGANGGAGRCGNLPQYQIKGIGQTPVIGASNDLMHNYGGLDAPLAIKEVIYTNLVNVLLPLGAVKIRSLILVGERSAYYHVPENPCWGVLMMRDHCIRPAHFMRAPEFQPQQKYRSMLLDDVARVRIANKELFRQFGEPNKFIQFLGKFLQNCANQFGFARAVRFMHGALTPSNITLEGKWLDLPIASMLGGGKNYCLTSEFYTEHQSPIEYAIELLHGYAKYNKIVLNPTPLINYYHKQFDAYFRHHIGYVLGLDSNTIAQLSSDDWEQITNAFGQVIHAGKEIDTRWPTFDSSDPVLALISAFYLSLKSFSEAESSFRLADVPQDRSYQLHESFRTVVREAANKSFSERSSRMLYRNFVIASALTAVKRTYLAQVFYGTAIERDVWQVCNEKSPDDVAPLIESYNNLSKWIFEEPSAEIVIFRSSEILCYFNSLEGAYIFKSKEEFAFRCYADLLDFIFGLDSNRLEINNFSFIEYFKAVENILTTLEKIED